MIFIRAALQYTGMAKQRTADDMDQELTQKYMKAYDLLAAIETQYEQAMLHARQDLQARLNTATPQEAIFEVARIHPEIEKRVLTFARSTTTNDFLAMAEFDVTKYLRATGKKPDGLDLKEKMRLLDADTTENQRPAFYNPMQNAMRVAERVSEIKTHLLPTSRA